MLFINNRIHKILPIVEAWIIILKAAKEPIRDACMILTISSNSESFLRITASQLFNEKFVTEG